LDWATSPSIQVETFTTSITFDALNRPVTETMPDRSVIRPVFNEANLLRRVTVNLRGTSTETVFVDDIQYNAKRQRHQIIYGNNTRTEYDYDLITFRLNHLITTRTSDDSRLQDLSYTYDPIGNITAIRDDAQETIYFRNSVVEPSAEYEYDALYRLISATGREHLGQNATQTSHDDSLRTNLPHPTEGNAMGNYTERYEYDAVGNILRTIHEAGAAGSWTRYYSYAAESNRLLHTSLPGDRSEGPYSAHYTYDAHGNMISMPHLPAMDWDYKDQLHSVRQQAVSDGESGETAYYVYDAGGQRVRKMIERAGGSIKNERFYLGAFEIYRERSNGGDVTLERETLHIMDYQRRIALVETKTTDSSAPPFVATPLLRYQLDNHLGSSSVELDRVGAVISYEEYYPYGSTSYRAVRSGVEVSPKRYRYTGKERDEETGLYYHGARYYAPWLGRWTSADSAGLVDGTNVFAYACHNPIKNLDSEGKQSIPHHRYIQSSGGEAPLPGPPAPETRNIDERRYEAERAEFERFANRPTPWVQLLFGLPANTNSSAFANPVLQQTVARDRQIGQAYTAASVNTAAAGAGAFLGSETLIIAALAIYGGLGLIGMVGGGAAGTGGSGAAAGSAAAGEVPLNYMTVGTTRGVSYTLGGQGLTQPFWTNLAANQFVVRTGVAVGTGAAGTLANPRGSQLMVTAYRFTSTMNVAELLPRLSQQSSVIQEEVMQAIENPAVRQTMASMHTTTMSSEILARSPFVSLTRDPSAAAQFARDSNSVPWLRDIIFGTAERSASRFIVEVRIPATSFTVSSHPFATGARELHYVGTDLQNFIIRWVLNPYQWLGR
jgi:RHS repeat-associated protein